MSNNDLQYGFQKGCSTLQCTWAVQETISHFLNNGSNVFVCLLDFSKAFDKINFNELFRKLLDRKVPFILLKLFLFIYKHQRCYVKWNSKKSGSFSVQNGVRQGAILSPCLFCVYLDQLLKSLRKSGLGCNIGGIYLGALGYADDIILMSPSRESLQLMLMICQEFADKHSMLFSTNPNPNLSKTKCMIFSRKMKQTIPKVKLNGESLPWVDSAKHLGNNLTVKLQSNPIGMDTSSDLLQKRAIFYQKVHELKQAFSFYDPSMICELIKIFGMSFYGSPLWTLNSEEHLKLNRSWNTTVKIVFDLPFQTHKRFVESLCDVPHLQSILHGRYIGFVENLKKSQKPEMKLLFNMCENNQHSNTGQNLNFLKSTYSLNSLEELIQNKHSIKKIRVNPLEEGEDWKPNMIKEICLAKKGFIDIGLEDEILEDLLNSICIE